MVRTSLASMSIHYSHKPNVAKLINITNMTISEHFSLYLVNCALQREMFQTEAVYHNDIYIIMSRLNVLYGISTPKPVCMS